MRYGLKNATGFYDLNQGEGFQAFASKRVAFAEPQFQTIRIAGEKQNDDQRTRVIIEITNADGLMATRNLAMTTVAGEVPMAHTLEQNYPRPFNSSTATRFAVPEQSHVTLAVNDVVGRRARR